VTVSTTQGSKYHKITKKRRVGVQAIMSHELLSISILHKIHGSPFSEANESHHPFSEVIFTALAISKVLPEVSSCIVYKSL